MKLNYELEVTINHGKYNGILRQACIKEEKKIRHKIKS